MHTRQLIIVEDDASTRRSLMRWARANGYEVLAFASASAFLDGDIDVSRTCLILDVWLPDIDGGELKRLHRRMVASGTYKQVSGYEGMRVRG